MKPKEKQNEDEDLLDSRKPTHSDIIEESKASMRN